MALHAAAVHDAFQGVEGGEQGSSAVPLVIVRHGSALAGLHRQAGLGAVERQDLRLLVNRQHHRMSRGMHVEPDDILDLLGERGIGGALEDAQAMRLQPAFQIRCTVFSESPTVLAMARPVQWVISPGGSPQVSARTLLTVSIGTGFLPGGRVLSRSRPSMPASA